MVLATRRLPGIAVAAAPPPLAEALPRMDVAVFVGFASTGPLHLPVVVEGVSQFAAVFGADAPLAWDAARGERVRAYLGPAVRAFFSNGGRRCWVIRVARTAAMEALRPAADDALPVATANTFAIPGVLEVNARGLVGPALAQARCEGSWSDALRVQTALSRQSFVIESAGSSSPPGEFRFLTRADLRVGDLIELEELPDTTTYAAVTGVGATREPGGPNAVETVLCAAFERVTAQTSPVVDVPGQARIDGFVDAGATLSFPDDANAARLRFAAPVPADIERGHWVRWSAGMEDVWLRIDAIERTPVFDESPTPPRSLIQATVTGPAWRLLDPGLASLATARRAHVVTLDVHVASDAAVARAAALGLTPRHRASWWRHVTDTEFYADDDSAGRTDVGRLVRSDVQRFPLARVEAQVAPVAWLPLGATPVFDAALAPLPQQTTALERDGLAAFAAGLFVDPELAPAAVHGLLALADSIRFMRDDTRRLFGMHAALSVGRGGLFNEASLLAIPDAVHPGWERRADEPIPAARPQLASPPAHWRTHRGPCATAPPPSLVEPDFGVFLDCDTRMLDAPELFGPDGPVPPGAFRLTWTDVQTGAEYTLLEATQPDFSDSREVARSHDTEYVALAPRDGGYYYRVYARVDGEQSAGSNVVGVRVRRDQWVQLEPALSGESLEGECLAVQRAALRLAAASGDLFVVLALPRHFRTDQALRYVQRLRSVNDPRRVRDPGAFDFTEARALSYGALYFPWLQSAVRVPAMGGSTAAGTAATPLAAATDRQPLVVPPDGVAMGVLAARATARGAWVAAANQPYNDVVALTPDVPAADWQRLQDAQLNLIRAEPRGFLTLSTETLALEPELRLINVRRLLILLRRVALRRGHDYVFEPHGPTLRRAVQRAFELLLTDMFRRGAFAGATAAQSFRVVADDTVNTARDVAAGRLVVELRVAPSVPLAFLTVRLAQSGARLTVSEEL